MTQFTIPTLLKLTYYDFCNIHFYWFSRDSYCFSLILVCIFFLLLYLTFDIKRSGSWPLAVTVSLTHSLILSLAVICCMAFFQWTFNMYLLSARHFVGTGDTTVNKTESILAFVELIFFREFLFSFMIAFLSYSYFQSFILIFSSPYEIWPSECLSGPSASECVTLNLPSQSHIIHVLKSSVLIKRLLSS